MAETTFKNPNVDPIVAGSMNFPQGIPAAQVPATSAPQIQTPAVPTPAVTQPPQTTQPPATTVNVNTAPTEPAKQPEPKTQAAGTSLAMPANGSVVDLLNMAGQDSSYAARQQLAQQYGIQGYSGTAAQNQELSKKYVEAFNTKKGTTVPQNSAEASSSIDSYFKDEAPQTKTDPQAAFYDAYAGMNPVVKTLYDNLNNLLSSTGTKQTFTEEFQKLRQEQGVEGLSTELMNIKNIMDGTEDDIREEITKAGGFATDSQVQALTGARNKTLLKQAQNLSDQLQIRNDYIDQVMKLSGADRDQVEKDIDRKLGITEKVATLQTQMDTAARTNYNNIVTQVGYSGLAQGLQGNKKLQTQVENLMGLNPGALTEGSAFLRAQSMKDKGLQFVSGTENQASGVFDPNTGTFTARGGYGGTGGTGGGAAGGVVSGSVTRDADSVMAGVLNLQDISTAKNYRASVSAELSKRAQQALESGDIYGVMRASAAYDKEPGDEFLKSMEKSLTVLDQIGTLQSSFDSEEWYDDKGVRHTMKTGPLIGAFRGANPWDTNAQTIKAQLNAIVPNLARGVYGEVGVLTDNDIKNYSKTLPTLTSTEDIRNAVLYITTDMIAKSMGTKLKNQAAGQRDVSGYADLYKTTTENAKRFLEKLPEGSAPGTAGGVAGLKAKTPAGQILVAREHQDGTRHYTYIKPDELWATDIKQ